MSRNHVFEGFCHKIPATRSHGWMFSWSVGFVRTVVFVCLAWGGIASSAWAQNSSLLGDSKLRPPLLLEKTSWTYQSVAEPRELRLHDLITVLVDEKSSVISEGEVDRRKKADGTMSLTDWASLRGWSLRPDPQTLGEPSIAGEMQSKYSAEAEMETREAMTSRMTCRVVDIRPNGHIVLEGHRMVRINNESWELSLSGIARPEDIDPNNTIRSENIADLSVFKREAGHVRDGYRRGWLMRILDKYKPL